MFKMDGVTILHEKPADQNEACQKKEQDLFWKRCRSLKSIKVEKQKKKKKKLPQWIKEKDRKINQEIKKIKKKRKEMKTSKKINSIVVGHDSKGFHYQQQDGVWLVDILWLGVIS